MSEQMSQKDWQAIQAFSQAKKEPAFLLALREKAFQNIDHLDLPDTPKMDVKRWPLYGAKIQGEGTTDFELDERYQHKGQEALMNQFGDQTLSLDLSQNLEDQGVILMDIFEAMQAYPDFFKDYYMTKAAKPGDNKITAYHTAYMNSGIFLYVPENVQVEEPIVVNAFQDASQDLAYNHHVLIVAEAHAKFSFVERFQTHGDQANSANILTEIIAADHAEVHYAALDELGENTTGFITRRGHCGPEARIDWAVGMLNDGNVVADYNAELIGDGSVSYVNVVGISDGKQTQGVNSRVSNYGRHSVGHIYQKGVILDRSRLAFNGIGHIYRGAVGADAQQEERILMFSDRARGDVNPILLIDENDVTAGHAASMGRVDQEELYYLMSRGISGKEAQRLVIRGFLGSVIVAIPLQEMREELIEIIDKKLMAIDND
ncbi:Fe-S cluster assembly protein SufD [Aerococcus sp. UMB7834]|uniref:Fe-S cluster assembly protein SufD n=1 Tax=Aerococcus sp. UMB7834 TaxID=3046342 RepID=UPI00254ED1E2|nr:Fe-S cluster assembly protein SufD [Aerococcus sp. UMB7834]MDK6804332.1 Fe-S cluster assembly protein SufD [Aerococcus sp. UMB7834]